MKGLLTTVKHWRDLQLIKKSQLFDERYYVTHYPAVLQSGLGCLEHYLQLGSAAGMRPNAFFDDAYYREANPDVRVSGVNPLVHYIKCGAREGRNPSRSFNTRQYLEKHPDVAAQRVNPLWHYLTYGASEHREIDNTRMRALSADNKVLYEQLGQIEPLLPPFEDLLYVPLDCGATESLAGRAYFKLAESISTPFTHLFVLQRLIHGGAATLSMHYANLVKERCGADAAVVILADLPDRPASHLVPEGVKLIALDDLQPGLSEEEKIQLLARFVVESKPKVVHNLDSKICWETFRRYHKQFHPHTALIASLFMFTYNQAGRKAGYVSDYLNSCIENLDLIVTDNHTFKDEAARFYALEEYNLEKIVVVYTPILSQFHEPDSSGAVSKRILWSSRLHPDKRPDVLVKIARCLPDFTFEIYGDSALDEAEMRTISNLKNVRLHGPYFNSQSLPRVGIGAYLHTARHEGGAITLKEAIVAGLPVIAPPLGIIPDIVGPDTGWLVASGDDVQAYVDAIQECVSNPQERLRRIRNAQELLAKEHSWQSFAATVASCPEYYLPDEKHYNN